MALSRRTGARFQASIWPGFVDAMTGLLLVLMFVLTIFAVMQFVLQQTIKGQGVMLDELNVDIAQKNAQLEDLEGQILALGDALGLERAAASTSKVGVIGFYYPDRLEPVDKLCNAGFLGNFWNTETFGGRIAVAKKPIMTEENIRFLDAHPQHLERLQEIDQISDPEDRICLIRVFDHNYPGFGEGAAEEILSDLAAGRAIGASSAAVAF